MIFESISSKVIDDYSSKKDMYLSHFQKIKLTDAILQIYKSQYNQLSHVRINKDTKGYVWLDDQDIVGLINVEEKDDDYKWIISFEIFGKYKGHGLSKQILKVAVNDLGVTHLSVNKSNQVAYKLYKSYGFKTYKETEKMYFMSIHKVDDIDESVTINEEAIFSKTQKNPVYIVLMHSGTLLANAIKKVTGDEFSHACISFNSKLDPLYSFGTKGKGEKGIGFTINDPKDKFFTKFNSKYSVYVMYVTDNAYKSMKNRLSYFTNHKDSLKYDFKGLFDIWFGKESEDHEKWFCSRFVMEIISKAQELSKVPSLWKPNDITQLQNISLINRGFNFFNYDYKVTEKHCNDIKKGKYSPSDVIYESNHSEYLNYMTTGSESYLYEEYKRIYKNYNYKIPEVGFPTNDKAEYLAVKDAAINAAKGYYTFDTKDKNKIYPFKFYNTLELERDKYIELITGNCPPMKREQANLYQVNISDEWRKISVIMIAIPGEIFAMYLLLDNNVLYRFNYSGVLFQESSIEETDIEDESTKYYKNPAMQLKVKSTKKKTSQTKAGNYSGSAPSVPVPKAKNNIKESAEENNELLSKAEYAKKLLTKEIVACKDCAYMYEDIMLPYAKDNSFAIIGWNLNKAKNNDQILFPKCRSAVFNYCSKIFNDINKGYCLNMDDSCFYIEKINQ